MRRGGAGVSDEVVTAGRSGREIQEGDTKQLVVKKACLGLKKKGAECRDLPLWGDSTRCTGALKTSLLSTCGCCGGDGNSGSGGG